MFGLGAGEIVVILLLALIVVGPKKIPELAKGLGRGLREFQKAKDNLMTGSIDYSSDEMFEAQKDELAVKRQDTKKTDQSKELDEVPKDVLVSDSIKKASKVDQQAPAQHD